MTRVLVFLVTVLFSGFGHTEEVESKANQDQISYSIGVNVGRNISASKLSLNHDYFLMGVKDGQANKLSFMKDEEISKLMVDLQQEISQKMTAEKREKSAKNLAEAEKFLAANKKKRGVVTLPSGLQYRVVKKGSGDSPKAQDKVTLNYRGKLLDGTEFDSSYAREKPATFPVNRVIPGWTEALQLMKPGAKWEVFIPAKLAYGENSPNPTIGPNSCLVFEIDLISIEKAPEQPKQPQEPEEVKEPELKE